MKIKTHKVSGAELARMAEVTEQYISKLKRSGTLVVDGDGFFRLDNAINRDWLTARGIDATAPDDDTDTSEISELWQTRTVGEILRIYNQNPESVPAAIIQQINQCAMNFKILKLINNMYTSLTNHYGG